MNRIYWLKVIIIYLLCSLIYTGCYHVSLLTTICLHCLYVKICFWPFLWSKSIYMHESFLHCIYIISLEISIVYVSFRISEYSAYKAYRMYTRIVFFIFILGKTSNSVFLFKWSMWCEEVLIRRLFETLNCYNLSIYFISGGIFRFLKIMWF